MISHPNKNPDPESKKLFVKIATAYEDPRAVLVGLLVVLSAFQYLNNVARYNEALATVKRTPAYKNRLKALELERTGGVASKKKGPKQIDQKLQQELSNELDLQIKGAEKPSVWDLLGVRFVLLPYTIIKLLVWYSSWMHISRKIWYREGYGRSRTLRTTMQKCLKN
ncbi:chaperone protein dnaJ 50-like [Raphanus sativus]|uniref:Chaperone protein dnaJ 50-like n=1 Tax=Raphanus sativus TaxID=3726 RepID=A0A9W3DKZ5_RAPSA|nr:chaperone protein dnaJ 50-like [Raphanus sativus]